MVAANSLYYLYNSSVNAKLFPNKMFERKTSCAVSGALPVLYFTAVPLTFKTVIGAQSILDE